MFGKRGNEGFGKSESGSPQPPPRVPSSASGASTMLVEPSRSDAPARQQVTPPPIQTPQRRRPQRTEEYYDTKSQVFAALIDTIDLSQLSKLDAESAREEIRDIVNDIITIKNFAMSISEQEELLDDICNDVLGYGPLEP